MIQNLSFVLKFDTPINHANCFDVDDSGQSVQAMIVWKLKFFPVPQPSVGAYRSGCCAAAACMTGCSPMWRLRGRLSWPRCDQVRLVGRWPRHQLWCKTVQMSMMSSVINTVKWYLSKNKNNQKTTRYARYCHKANTIVFTIICAVIWTTFHSPRTIIDRIGLSGHSIHSSAGCSASHLKNKEPRQMS